MTSLAVTVLGSSAMFATRHRACSGYLVELDDARVWMDAGGGTWSNLLGVADYRRIDAVLLSHRHPDHTIDLFQGFHARMYGQREPLAPIPLWAPAEAIERLTAFAPDLHESFDIKPVAAGDTIGLFGATVEMVRMAHPPETLGMRIEAGGRTLAYSADTGPGADFARLAGRSDLFICEATFQDSDEEWEGHMSAAQAARAATEVGAHRMLLTHLPPGRDHGLSLAEAERHAADVKIQLAADGLRIDLEDER